MLDGKPTKLQVLELLKNDRKWVSGEGISEALGISRAAVAKHISALRTEGYLVEAFSRRGYLLKMEPDEVNSGSIKKKIRTNIVGQGQWLWLDKTGSTNNEAALLGADGAPEGSLVLAGYQTQGRGRRGREWFTAPRSIHFSTLLRPGLPARRLSILSLIACLAVHKTLAELTGLEAIIKWPNDILLNGKKTAAILTEANIVGGEVDWAVIGIGCNLNAASEEFPEELKPVITSVYEETHTIFPRNLVYEKLITDLDAYYRLWLKKEAKPLIDEWKTKTNIIGQKLRLTASSPNIVGKAVDMNHDGLLIVLDRSGQEHQLEVGDYTVS